MIYGNKKVGVDYVISFNLSELSKLTSSFEHFWLVSSYTRRGNENK